MSIITRVKAASAAFLQPRVALSLTDADGWKAVSNASESGEPVTQNTAMALSAVWACSNLIAGTIASLPIMIYAKNRDGRKVEVPDHPLYRVLHDSPNADQSDLQFFEYQQLAIELWGNAYAEKHFGAGGKLVALTPINPGRVQVFRERNGSIGYRWEADNGTRRTGGEDTILHLRGFGGHPLGGLSTLAFARNSFGLAAAIERSASSTFKNGMRPAGALTFEKFLTDDQYNTVVKRLTEKYIGAVNTGKPMILEGGTKWAPFSINPEDAQMLESRRFSVEEIARFFQVPPHMIGHTEKSSSWGSGLEQQTLAFQKFTLRVRMKRIEKGLERQLLTPADRARGVSIRFNIEGLLRGDSSARSRFYESALRNGWMTINEVRELEGLDPVTGGEVPRMQMQNIPITEAGNGTS